MDLFLVASSLIHLCLFAYWLGGDLAVFYLSTHVSKSQGPAEQRLYAVHLLNQLDLIPRTALIITLPSGLMLANSIGWLMINSTLLIVLWLACLCWVGLIFTLHSQADPWYKKIDTLLRIGLMIGLMVWVISIRFNPDLKLPLFIQIKLLILGVITGCGLLIRILLKPLFESIADLKQHGASETINQSISNTLNKTRIVVIIIWVLLATAAALGVARPV